MLLLTVTAMVCTTSTAFAERCSLTADVTSGSVVDMTSGPGSPAEKPDLRRLHRQGVFFARTAARIDFDGVRYELGEGSITTLRCFRRTRAEDARHPSLELMRGSATAVTRAGRPAAIISNEGLFEAYRSRAARFTVVRTPRGAPSAEEVFEQGPSTVQLGSSRISRTGSGYLAITPYVGPRSGTCRYARGAKLTSRRFARGGFLGSSSFTGLAPFSPR